MKNVAMRFCGYDFHHNPATLKIESEGNIRELTSPCCEPKADHLGYRLRHISGEGELYGADCIAQFRELMRLHENGTSGLLTLPHMPPIEAYLKELQMLAQPKEDVLTYRFEFVEQSRCDVPKEAFEYYETIVPGESLWDIGYRYHVAIDTLVGLNPQIEYIDSLKEGERVRLC